MKNRSLLIARALLSLGTVGVLCLLFIKGQAQVPLLVRCPTVLAVDVGPDWAAYIDGFNDPAINQQKSVAGLAGATVDGQPCAFTEAPAPPLDSTLSGW